MIENQDFERYLKTLHEHLCCNMSEKKMKKNILSVMLTRTKVLWDIKIMQILMLQKI